jgi:hypothetical protein
MSHKYLTKDGTLKYQSIKSLVTATTELYKKVMEIAGECGMPVDGVSLIKPRRVYSPEDIIYKVNKRFGVNLKEKSKKEEIVQARDAAVFLLKKYTTLGLRPIARKLGYKEHTAASHGLTRAMNLMSYNENFKANIESLIAVIEEHGAVSEEKGGKGL